MKRFIFLFAIIIITACEAVTQLDAVPVVVEETPPPKEEFSPYKLAEFPMGCQYKEYELCNPVYKAEELTPEDYQDNAYNPLKRLYFPYDWWASIQDINPYKFDLDYYVGTFLNLAGKLGEKLEKKLEIKIDEKNILTMNYLNDRYVCDDLVVKGRNYIIYHCQMQLFNYETPEYLSWMNPPFKGEGYIKLEAAKRSLLATEDMPYDMIYLRAIEHLPCLQEVPYPYSLENKWHNFPSKSPLCIIQNYPLNRDYLFSRGSSKPVGK